MITKEAIRGKREAILEIARRFGAHDVRIFGSVARGDATEDSDLDIIVRFDPGRSLLDHGGLLMDLRELLGVNIKRFLTPLFLLVPSPQPNHPWPAGDTASIG